MWVYAVVSQKGGVGKTTTAVNLGAALAEMGRRVLLVDLDPQGSLTAAVGRQPGPVAVGDVLLQPDRILSAIQPCAGSMRVVTATAQFANVILELDQLPDPVHRLARALAFVADCHDYCLIDCPPSLSHATTNGLTAAQVALVPLQCEFLSLRGLSDVQEIALTVRETTNPHLRMRVVATMFDRRTIHAQDVLREARAALPGLVCQSVIPRTVRLAEAPAVGQTILEYAPDSNGAFGYRALAQELLAEDGSHEKTRRHPDGDAEPARVRTTA
ncbi:MAG TPA: ParA family protein [Chthonomonadales bacterium]|nr:ParA family protein [Chthonomonadales bacterium]